MNLEYQKSSHNKNNKSINVKVIFFKNNFAITSTCFDLDQLQGVTEQTLMYLNNHLRFI